MYGWIRSHAHLLNHMGLVTNVYSKNHLTLTKHRLFEVCEKFVRKERLYSQPSYDPFQLTKEMALYQPFYDLLKTTFSVDITVRSHK